VVEKNSSGKPRTQLWQYQG
jgi:hypothetical protein